MKNRIYYCRTFKGKCPNWQRHPQLRHIIRLTRKRLPFINTSFTWLRLIRMRLFKVSCLRLHIISFRIVISNNNIFLIPNEYLLYFTHHDGVFNEDTCAYYCRATLLG